MLGERPYAPARSVEDARAELLAVRGTQLDPHIVDTFLRLQSADLIGQLHRLDARSPSTSVRL